MISGSQVCIGRPPKLFFELDFSVGDAAVVGIANPLVFSTKLQFHYETMQ
ncbi:uncharacterized protein METZ01_LOCUS220863 [marine metagenome]|uniref:Uncharacterized protein n=1 Tax=marine metagenome TaxID=408172 RepID=A0A382FZG8_9ZZZZ